MPPASAGTPAFARSPAAAGTPAKAGTRAIARTPAENQFLHVDVSMQVPGRIRIVKTDEHDLTLDLI